MQNDKLIDYHEVFSQIILISREMDDQNWNETFRILRSFLSAQYDILDSYTIDV